MLRTALSLAAIVAIGCTGSGDEAGHAPTAPGAEPTSAARPAPIDIDGATRDVGELLRATRLSPATTDGALGPHHLEVATTTEVREGNVVIERLTERVVVDLGADATYHAVYENSKDYGREVFFLGGQLYLRPRYGKFHRRPPTSDDEPTRIRDDIGGGLAATLELIAKGSVASDGGQREVGGRAARIVTLASGEGPPANATSSHETWRNDAVVKNVVGEIALDAASGAALGGKLSAIVEFQRDGRHFAMGIEVEHNRSGFGSAPVITAPAEEAIAVGTEVPRELEEREDLLRGIAPPAARARNPDNANR